jgi:hypothetical protein
MLDAMNKRDWTPLAESCFQGSSGEGGAWRILLDGKIKEGLYCSY